MSDKVFKEKEHSNYFSNEPLRGRRVIIPVSPGNYRDSITLTVPQLNSVKLLEAQCAQIASFMGSSAYGLTAEEFEQKLKTFSRKFSFFYDRDITKEGITKPRQLLIAILEVLKEKYPNCPCWKYSGIYNNYFLFVENEWKEVPRGHGLGMANALTTIMQCALNELILDEFSRSDEIIVDEEIGFLTYNDDYTAGFQNESDLQAYIEIDRNILEKYQIIISTKKTHGIQEGFVFCERYYPEYFNRKDSYKVTELNYSYLMNNIYEAKVYVSTVADKVPPYLFQQYFKEIVSFWGYEFFENEWEYPFSFGGWINPNILGVRTDFYDLNLSPEAKDAYFACKAKYTFRKSKGDSNRKYYSPFSQIFKGLSLPDRFSKLFNSDVYYWEISRQSEVYKNDSVYNRIIDLIALKRRNIYQKEFGKNRLLQIKDFFQDFLETHPFHEVLPPKQDIVLEEVIEENESTFLIKDDFVPNRALSFIKYFNEESVDATQIPNPFPFLVSTLDNSSIFKEIEDPGGKKIVYMPSYNSEFTQYYNNLKKSQSDFLSINHNRYVTAYCNMSGNKGYPICRNYIRKYPFEIKPWLPLCREILASDKRDMFIKLVEHIKWHNIREYLENQDILEFLNSYDYKPEKDLKHNVNIYIYNPHKPEEINDLSSEESISEKADETPYLGRITYREWLSMGRPQFEPRIIFDEYDTLFVKNESNRETNKFLSSNPDLTLQVRNIFSEPELKIIFENSFYLNDSSNRNQVFYDEESSSEEEPIEDYGLWD